MKKLCIDTGSVDKSIGTCISATKEVRELILLITVLGQGSMLKNIIIPYMVSRVLNCLVSSVSSPVSCQTK